ncbi:hypothetical protein GVN19_26135 [Pseudomonas monteilii]|nr:hypothetical protein [Pseudomonas monteilii]
MVTPVCAVFVPDELINAFDEIFGVMNELGITLDNPICKLVSVFDIDGEKMNVGISDVRRSVSSRKIVSVQYWIDDSQDVLFHGRRKHMALFLISTWMGWKIMISPGSWGQ